MSDKDAIRWERVRTRGKMFYILRKAALFTLFMLIALNVSEFLFRGRLLEFSYVHLCVFVVLGFLAGFTEWWSNNARYQTYLLDKKIAKGLAL